MINLNLSLKNYSNWFLGIFFILAIALRWLYLPQNAVSFAYDQARDGFVVQELLNGHFKILGPSVSGVPGLFHGVLYYYIIAPAYYFGHGNPIFVAYLLSFVSSLGVFVVYFLTKILTKEKIPALFAAFIFAISFESSQYANLMTNASMGAWFIPILYVGLYLWITKSNKWAPVITGLGLGLSIQSEIALAYHFAPVVLWLFVCRKNINIKQVVVFSASVLIAISTMIVSEIKFGFTGFHGILYLLSGGDSIAKSKHITDYFSTLISQSGKTFAYTIFPIKVFIGGLLGFGMICISLLSNVPEIKKTVLTWETFLTSWIFAYAIALPFGGSNMKHILVGVAPVVAVYTGIFLWKYIFKNKLILVCVLLSISFANLFMIFTQNKNGQTIFPLQQDLVLQKELSLVDYSYQKSNGAPFSISSLTSPLFVNTLWSYLYNWHGMQKYGYVPSWFGRDQVSQLGDNLKFVTRVDSEHYFIIEPTYGIPELWVTYAKGDQDAVSKLKTQANFGELVIQERQAKK